MKKNKQKTKKTEIALVIAALLMGFLYYENNHIVTTEYAVDSAEAPDGFRIVQISDLHNARFGRANERLIKIVKEAQPDIIVITGDFIDSRRTRTGVSLDFSIALTEICPVYYVSGNHEMRLSQSEQEEFYRSLEENGVKVLRDQVETIGIGDNRINIIGLFEYSIFGDTLKNLKNEVSREDFTILLSHEPQYIKAYADPVIDLVFSGHAHGGQFRLPLIGPVIAPGQGFFPKYTEGIYTEGNTKMVVSRGIGNSLFPFRLFNDPEIVVAELGN